MKHATAALLNLPPMAAEGLKQWLSHSSVNDNIKFSVVTLTRENAPAYVSANNPTLIITDPVATSASEIEALRRLTGRQTRIVALYHSALPQEIVNVYDDTLSIYDSAIKVNEVAEKAVMPGDSAEIDEDSRKELSPREKDVVIGIVKGMSNKEIASMLNVSANTVMTHRRNIASKLKIHSPAGLTIYAIVSKLVKIEEVSGL